MPLPAIPPSLPSVNYVKDSSGNIIGTSTPTSGAILGPAGWVPPTHDYAGIIAAYNAAVAAGGGVVSLQPVTYNIGGNTIPLASNIVYAGSVVGWDMNYKVSSVPIGTTIYGNATAPCFGYNMADLNPWSATSCTISGTTLTIGGSVVVNGNSVSASSTTFSVGTSVTGKNIAAGTFITAGSGTTYTINNTQTVSSAQSMSGNSPTTLNTLLTGAIIGAGIQNLAITNGSYGIKLGAMFSAGCNFFKIDNVIVANCTQWGVWVENCNDIQWGSVVAEGCGIGQVYYGSSGGMSNGQQNYGDAVLKKIFFQVRGNGSGYATANSRGVVIEARGYNSATNDLTVVQCSGNHGLTTLMTDTATFDGTTANISVGALQHYALDTGITFTANLGTNVKGGSPGPAYFVTYMSGSTGAGTIQIAASKGGTPIVCSASGSLTVNNWGGQLLEVGGRASVSATTQSVGTKILHSDMEGGGTVTLLAQYAQNFRHSVDATYINNGVCLRSIDTGGGTSALINVGASSSYFDVDSGSKKTTITGVKPLHIVTGGNFPTGLMYDELKSSQGLWLQSNGGSTPDIEMPNNTWQCLNFNSMIRVPMQAQGAGTLNVNTGQAVSINSSGAAMTLPTITTDMTGVPYFINNPFAASATVATSSSQNIVGLALSATSATILGYSSIMLIAQVQGGTYYWARYA